MTTTDTPAESQPFQAEVSELLHLMVHSVYSETDIFLRELISNASDACDKLRYEAIANPDLIADGAPPNIRIAPDKKANTLSVIDSGIGMDRQELIDNLGTLARSGTKSFLSRLTEANDGAGLIRQGASPLRRIQPPRRQRRGLDLVVVGLRRIRCRSGQCGRRRVCCAGHRDRAA